MSRQLAVVAYWNTLKCTVGKKNRRISLLDDDDDDDDDELEEEEEDTLLTHSPFLVIL
jgi:hypothetical protein